MSPDLSPAELRLELLSHWEEENRNNILRLWDADVERTAGNILVSPLDNEDVAALLLDRVGDVVHPVAHVFDIHLLTGCFWSVNTHHQHVGACGDTCLARVDASICC